MVRATLGWLTLVIHWMSCGITSTPGYTLYNIMVRGCNVLFQLTKLYDVNGVHDHQERSKVQLCSTTQVYRLLDHTGPRCGSIVDIIIPVLIITVPPVMMMVWVSLVTSRHLLTSLDVTRDQGSGYHYRHHKDNYSSSTRSYCSVDPNSSWRNNDYVGLLEVDLLCFSILYL